MRRPLACCILLLLCFTLPSQVAAATSRGAMQQRVAIVVAHFGTTVPTALKAITTINDLVRQEFPETEVRVTFTSNIIRSVWRQRQADAETWVAQGVPEEILYVKNIIATIGDLLEDGYDTIVVQPSHMFYMEQSHDLQQYLNGLTSIRTIKKRWQPFSAIVMGRPALGMPGNQYPYHNDIAAVAQALATDASQAKEAKALLVYMGHGNEYWSTGIYAETEKTMRTTYPEVETFIGVVEGTPSLDDLLTRLPPPETAPPILLKPFMVVAGDHAQNDMAGPEPDSWRSQLTSRGYQVTPVLAGLGENEQFARIFVSHLRDVARDHGIQLR